MTIIGPLNYQAIYENDVWSVFHALGTRYSVFLIHPTNGPTLWLIPPDNKRGLFHTDAPIINVLVENGFVEKRTIDNLPYSAEALYEITDKGRDLMRWIDAQVQQLPEHERFAAGLEVMKAKSTFIASEN